MPNNNEVRFHLVIPAAGTGKRVGGEVPKQYQPLAGKTVLEKTLDAFLPLPGLQKIVLALHPQDKHFVGLSLCENEKITTVAGGEERAHSVFNAMAALVDQMDNKDWVLVHDAARPCLETADIETMLSAFADHEVGGIMAIPASDTIKTVSADGEITGTQDRSILWQAQTPQMFRFGVLFSALKNAFEQNARITDESSAVELLGYKPKIFQGKRSNIKITLPEDLAIAEQILGRRL